MARISAIAVYGIWLLCETERMIDRLLHAVGYERRYYSQKGQDRWAVERVFNNYRGGYFIEIGAGDGRTHSNTYVLERDYGWTGILMDANPDYAEISQRNRRCVSICACVDAEPQDVSFFRFGYMGGIISEDTDYAQKTRGSLLRRNADKTFKIRSQSLAQILDALDAPPKIQYLSIDVEGAEFRILSKFPFERYTFEAITVERPTYLVHQCLVEAGYVLAETKWYDGFYLHADVASRLCVRHKPFNGMAAKPF